MAVQLLQFKKSTGGGEVWINPDQIIYAEVVELKEGKGPSTIVHLTGKEGKVFIKEHPAEMNKIFSKFGKKELRITEQ